ncbi:MAG: hypothetical protein AAGD06_21875 [Acidobacteriota bacterium]
MRTSTQQCHRRSAAAARPLVLGALALLVAFPAVHGQDCTAIGGDAACRGEGSEASGNISTAIGSFTEAIGNISTATGSQTIACKGNAFAAGLRTIAETENSFVVGKYNVAAGDGEECADLTFQGQKPLFVVGNGLGPGGPTSERRKNTLTVLENGTTVIGTIRSSASNFGPLSTLNVAGNSYFASDIKVGRGMITVGRSPGNDFRDMSLWVGTGLSGTTCTAACASGVCLAAYVDQRAVQRVSCDVSSPNRNCLCVGRP